MNAQALTRTYTGNEPQMTVAQAVQHLQGCPALGIGELSALGKDCSRVARIWGAPTGTVPVVGKRWPSEKSYTFDVLKEVFSRNPSTKAYMPKESES